MWFFRALLLVPFILMGPEVIAAATGQPEGVAHVSASVADVLGTSTFLIFATMLAVSPLHTLTGWRWHIVLRRDYGIGMWAVATTDLILAALTTGDTFPGHFTARLGGHTFLLMGTISTLLLVPLVITANRPAQRWLGSHWKWIQRLTYVVWLTILVHLFLLFDLSSFFLFAVLLSVPLALLRLRVVSRPWKAARQARSHRVVRGVAAVALVAMFVGGTVPFVQELASKGSAAFIQQPVDDE
ncbi:MAG: methionine sulfoxide reductase heme-binding subunit [Chloroflexota bacterium]|nr:methionine sulfoxide reductase heme-binding subunit [Chloroflexota bacterium]